MDPVDLEICKLLLMDSRTTYRELGEQLGLSVNAVHKRVQGLIDIGVIRTFTAKLTLNVLGAVNVSVFGRSEAPVVTDLRTGLAADESTYWLGLGSGNLVYIGGYLRSLADLEPYLAKLIAAARLTAPTVGLMAPFMPPQALTRARTQIWSDKDLAQLTVLDYRLVHVLTDDARRSLTDLAAELGCSVRTVRNRITTLQAHHAVEFSMEWYPDAANDIITIFHLTLASPAEKPEVLQRLFQFGPEFLTPFSFGNIPDLLLAVVWTPMMKDLLPIVERFKALGQFRSIVPSVLFTGYMFGTWRERLPAERGGLVQRSH